jgi:hypothetical protein
MGGRCKVVETADGRAQALEIVFKGEPAIHAPSFQPLTGGKVKAHITGRDHRLVLIKCRLVDAMSFLECFHNIDLATDEIEAQYEGETPEEQTQIAIISFKSGRRQPSLSLTFDMFTRALMAAETRDGPHFEASLASRARETLAERRFIDSFRYSFLLIEAQFGEGQFKKAGLAAALKDNPNFVEMVQAAARVGIPANAGEGSKTSKFFADKPSAPAIIDHLVEMRGYYFHGNAKRKDAWMPNKQDSAEALAFLSMNIVQEIISEAATPMFEPALAVRHFNDAAKVGAILVFEVKYQFQEPDENFVRKDVVEIRAPGAKVTPKHANAIAQEFMRYFESAVPTAAVRTATCSVKASGQKVFDIVFHVSGN